MKFIYIIPIIIIFLFLTLFFVRLISPREIDDVSPEILCKQGDLEKSDILWVIPNFNNKPISENQKWCKEILALNKTLGLHGITHEFEEFGSEISQQQLKEAIKIFEQCFNQSPILFKPPQLKISSPNKKLIKQNNMKLKLKFNQLTSKVYHCSDSGKFLNRFIDLF